MAWVGYAEHDEEKTVRPVAWAGTEGGYLSKVKVSWSDTAKGRGPSGTAIRTGKAVYIQDIRKESSSHFPVEEALKRGYASIISLPLVSSGDAFGVLTIYGKEPNAFDADELELLNEMAGDLAFGIAGIRSREERRRAERALLDSEERTRTIVDSAYDGIISIDEQGTIESMNLAALKIFGYSSEEILGKNVKKLMPETYCDLHTAGLARYLETGRGKIIGNDTEVGGLRKDGTEFPMTIVVSETHLGDQRIFVGTVRDITDRKRAEEELKRTQEMVIRSEKLSSIGTLTAGAAHEILNPANTIGLHVQLMLKKYDEESREYKAAEVIYQGVKRINKICDDLRRFSRDEKPKFSPFDPNKVVQDTINLLLHELHLASVRHSLEPEGEDIRVVGDNNQIQQVFFNLIGNAKDAMPSGGDLAVVTAEVADQDKKWWECRVSDTGTGISEDVLPKLFDPFFTTKPEDEGTGLGLSVSFGIIESHGGKIWAESDGKKGSTFFVRLPVDEES